METEEEIMPENRGNIYLGLIVHFGAALSFLIGAFFLDWSLTPIRIVWNLTILFALTGLPFVGLVLFLEQWYPIASLAPLMLKDYFQGLIDTFVYGIAVGGSTIVILQTILSFLRPPNPDSTYLYLFFSLLVHFLLVDETYYFIHRILYHHLEGSGKPSEILKFFYRIHLPHHLVRNLDFLRGSHSSLIDNGILGFQLFSVIYGVFLRLTLPQIFLTYYLILALQIAHHANYTFNIGPLRYIFIDSHCHKIHHCFGGWRLNLGGVCSIWDLMLGTYYEDHRLSPNLIHQSRTTIPN